MHCSETLSYGLYYNICIFGKSVILPFSKFKFLQTPLLANTDNIECHKPYKWLSEKGFCW